MAAILIAVHGLVELSNGSYPEAAGRFLQVPFEEAEKFPHIMTARDIALYGGLTALASFSRADLKRRVVENVRFLTYCSR